MEMRVTRGTQERALMDGHEHEGRSILCFFDLSFSGDVWLARDVRSCTLNSETTRGRKTGLGPQMQAQLSFLILYSRDLSLDGYHCPLVITSLLTCVIGIFATSVEERLHYERLIFLCQTRSRRPEGLQIGITISTITPTAAGLL